MDVHSTAIRTKNMRAIRSKDTRPELQLRRALFSAGFLYRLHRTDLPGKPDLALTKFRSVIFVHGCFWHGHEGCRYFKLPKTNADFWETKIQKNQINDDKVIKLLIGLGWSVAVVWECALKEKHNNKSQNWLKKLSDWVLAGSRYPASKITISGKKSTGRL